MSEDKSLYDLMNEAEVISLGYSLQLPHYTPDLPNLPIRVVDDKKVMEAFVLCNRVMKEMRQASAAHIMMLAKNNDELRAKIAELEEDLSNAI